MRNCNACGGWKWCVPWMLATRQAGTLCGRQGSKWPRFSPIARLRGLDSVGVGRTGFALRSRRRKTFVTAIYRKRRSRGGEVRRRRHRHRCRCCFSKRAGGPSRGRPDRSSFGQHWKDRYLSKGNSIINSYTFSNFISQNIKWIVENPNRIWEFSIK